MKIVESILTNNPCYLKNEKNSLKGLMLHSVGCPQPSALGFLKSWNRPEAGRACVHAFIDGNTGIVYQTLPWEHRGWHGGKKASNDNYIGVEMCEPGTIQYVGGASFTCKDRDSALEVVKRTYNSAVELFAFLCKVYQLDPLEDGVIIGHCEGFKRGIASGHSDPEHLWNGLQSGYTMDGFRQDVANCMMTGNMASEEEEKEDEEEVIRPPMELEVAQTFQANGKRTVSEKGTALVAQFEGCKLTAYKCAAGVWTIGYGHTQGVEEGQTLPSEEVARQMLKVDLGKYADYVNQYVEKNIITFPLNQNQFDALTSFCYNCGPGNLQRLVTNRDATEVAEKMLLYNKAAGKVCQGLVNRRQKERELFLSLDEE